MRIHLGTSGFGFGEWAGTFYPKNLPPEERLAYYAARFDATEVNSSFYAMPRPAVLGAWAGQVPPGFSFSLKAPGRITHLKRLRDAGSELSRFLSVTAMLGPRLGALIFQLPPSLRKELPRLEEFLAQLPQGGRYAFEFRHPSWFDEEVLRSLRGAEAALVFNDADVEGCPLVETAPWGVLKLRRDRYTAAELASLARRIKARSWSEAFVFFKHEEGAAAVGFARRLDRLLGWPRGLRRPRRLRRPRPYRVIPES